MFEAFAGGIAVAALFVLGFCLALICAIDEFSSPATGVLLMFLAVAVEFVMRLAGWSV